jgi:membrane protease YdiL (CAAX protease family)
MKGQDFQNGEDTMPEDQNNLNEEVRPLIKYGWLRAILFLITALIISAIFGMIGLFILTILSGADTVSNVSNTRDLIKALGLPANILISSFGFGGMLVTVWIFSISGYYNDLIIGFVLGAVLISTGFSILFLTGLISIQQISPDWSLLGGYIIFFVIASMNEEIMIRGYMLNNFCQSMNRYLALLSTSFLFALLHLGNPNMTVISFINILLAGILLGTYYIYKRNLWLPISLHFAWNYFQGPVFGFEVSGLDITGMIIQQPLGDRLWTGGAFGFEGSLAATLILLPGIAFLMIKYGRQNIVARQLFQQ